MTTSSTVATLVPDAWLTSEATETFLGVGVVVKLR
jgi:hypothetical protein